MKEQEVLFPHNEKTVGDWAVDGLVAGIFAGALMLVYVVFVAMITGIPISVALGRFDPSQDGSWLIGLVGHLAVSGIYGLVFAVIWLLVLRVRPTSKNRLWLAGPIYGLALFLMARLVLLGTVNSPLQAFGDLHLVIAHLFYGLLLGLTLLRRI